MGFLGQNYRSRVGEGESILRSIGLQLKNNRPTLEDLHFEGDIQYEKGIFFIELASVNRKDLSHTEFKKL